MWPRILSAGGRVFSMSPNKWENDWTSTIFHLPLTIQSHNSKPTSFWGWLNVSMLFAFILYCTDQTGSLLLAKDCIQCPQRLDRVWERLPFSFLSCSCCCFFLRLRVITSNISANRLTLLFFIYFYIIVQSVYSLAGSIYKVSSDSRTVRSSQGLITAIADKICSVIEAVNKDRGNATSNHCKYKITVHGVSEL